MLDQTLNTRLSLVTAPAGYGKSVLIRDWLDSRPDISGAWIELDRRDNDATRFWRRTVEALKAAAIPIPEDVGLALGSGLPNEILRAVELLSDCLALVDRRVVLIFDDFHTVDAPLVKESFGFLRDTLPGDIGVIISSRHDPPLSSARLRVQRELVELREHDLTFTHPEVVELTDLAGLHLDEHATTTLSDITGGWAVALRLALVSLSSRGHDTADALVEMASQRGVLVDFFVEEVLSEIPAQTREFLLSTAILEEMNPSLAEAVTDAPNAQEVLDDLVHRSILTSRIDSTVGWFRFHALFADLLRIHLHRHKSAAEIAALHRRAAAWYREHGHLSSAIPHALESGDELTATNMLAELSPKLMATGRAATLLDLSEQIIAAVDEPSILQLVCKGEALHGLGDQARELDRILDHVERELVAVIESVDTKGRAASADDPRSWESPSSLPWLRAVRARRQGNVETLLKLNVPDVIPSPSTVVEAEIAEGLIWLERYEDADRLLEAPKRHAESQGYVPHIVHHLGLVAVMRTGQGRLGEAQAHTDRALSLCYQHGVGRLRHTMYARMAAEWLAWLRGDIGQAESFALEVQAFGDHAADVPLAVLQAQLRSIIRWSIGDRVGARQLLDHVLVTTTGRTLTGHFADRVVMAQARFDLLEGNDAHAAGRVPDWRVRLDRGVSTIGEWLVLKRLEIAVDGPQVPDEPLPAALHPSLPHRLEWQRIRAGALNLAGKRDQAVRALASSLKTASGISLIQPILDEREILGSLLPQAAAEANVILPGLAGQEDASVPPPVYVEPLTPREQNVLEHMTTHLTYLEIASEMYVSTNTVKTHQKAIFRKLAVSKRSDAVARARAYGLVS